MANEGFRTERDSLGELQVPADALWGAQTQRAIENFQISGLRMPREFIRALGLIKWAAATTNLDLDGLDAKRAAAIQKAALEVAEGRHDAHFPIDVFQTGSGTSTNMNANEVIAHLASRYAGVAVHPNDHVNMSQSSNDVIPTAIHLSALLVDRAAPAARARVPRRGDQPPHRRHRRDRQDRAHPPDGCDAVDLRSGDERLARADRSRERAHHGVPHAPAGARSRRHGSGYRHQCTSALCGARGALPLGEVRPRAAAEQATISNRCLRRTRRSSCPVSCARSRLR